MEILACLNFFVNSGEFFEVTFKKLLALLEIEDSKTRPFHPQSNGKVFIDDGVYVQIWEEVEEVLLKFEKYF